jgi:hypothetical protein
VIYARSKCICQKSKKFLKKIVGLADIYSYNIYTVIHTVINEDLKPSKIQKQTRLQMYRTLAIPILLSGSETWILKEQDNTRITAAEMKFLRKP